ncbi:hypothetical protein PRIPAC_72680 [Pristionchus pacificus]|uniref:F-box domain-containing protein n=1 Tax=Pristionchus pacificus TaxID=54126 RepID=A0A2A6C1H3_PRIPA|nr:hypothetical protein PRIPAC_72680 [Pristionchus pacificus]|eukprot:PDM71873.1 F-box domain-containing protein [Pristionchus pacificus]
MCIDFYPPEILKMITDHLSYDDHLALSQTCRRLYAFSPSCEIDTLKLNKDYPLPIDGDNLKHLSSILTNCIIDKVTLVIGKMTETNFDEIINFLDTVHATKVDFVLPKRPNLSVLSPLLRDDFASRLVRAGIEEVTFSSYRFILPENESKEERVKSQFVSRLLQRLFNAGIKNVVVDYDGLLNETIHNREQLDILLKETEEFKKPLLLRLNFPQKAPHNLGCFSEDNEALGRRVRVFEWKNTNRVPWSDNRICHSITLEYVAKDDKSPHNTRKEDVRIQAPTFRQRIE